MDIPTWLTEFLTMELPVWAYIVGSLVSPLLLLLITDLFKLIRDAAHGPH